MNRQSRTAGLTFLSALLAAGVLLPPELQPAGLALESGLAALLVAALALQEPAPLDPSRWSIALPAALAGLPGVLFSFQSHTSAALLFHLLPAAAAFAAARRLAGFRDPRETIRRILIGLGGLAALWGVTQSLFSLSRTARYLRSLGQPDLDPMILRAESGRAFGPFLLPADLGIFLAMTLPLAAAWLFSEKRRGLRALAGAILVAHLAGLAACRSYGGILSLLAAGLALLPFSRVQGKKRIGWGLAGAGLAGALAVFVLRGSEGLAPLRLRLENWRLAWKVFAGHPFFGVGFGNLGDAMTAFQRPEMNETVYAHNSYLQIAAEGGMAAAVLMAAALAVLIVRMRRGLQEDPEGLDRLVGCLPVAAFLIHNLFDFSAYLPSLLLPFAALCGLAVRRTGPRPQRAVVASRWIPLRVAALVILLLAAAGWGLREARTEFLLQTGRRHLQEGRQEAGVQALKAAARLNPAHPDPPAVLAEVYLTALGAPSAQAEEGERWARSAVARRPQRAYGHYVLSLYRLAKGDLGESIVELSRARRLYPGREIYRLQEAHLREMITSAAAHAQAAHGE